MMPADSVGALGLDADQAALYRCHAIREGRFNRLRCILKNGHRDDHNFVVLGVRKAPEDKKRTGRPVKLSKDE